MCLQAAMLPIASGIPDSNSDAPKIMVRPFKEIGANPENEEACHKIAPAVRFYAAVSSVHAGECKHAMMQDAGRNKRLRVAVLCQIEGGGGAQCRGRKALQDGDDLIPDPLGRRILQSVSAQRHLRVGGYLRVSLVRPGFVLWLRKKRLFPWGDSKRRNNSPLR